MQSTKINWTRGLAILAIVMFSIAPGFAGLNPPITEITYEVGGAPTPATNLPDHICAIFVEGRSLSEYAGNPEGTVNDSDIRVTKEDGVEVGRESVDYNWGEGEWEDDDNPTTVGSYNLTAVWKDRTPYFIESDHEEIVTIELVAPLDVYEANSGAEYTSVTLNGADVTGDIIYMPFNENNHNVLDYSSEWGSAIGGDMDVHRWRAGSCEIHEASVLDGSWSQWLIGDDATTAGTYTVKACFRDDDSPRGATELPAPARAGSNDTGETTLSATVTVNLVAVAIQPQLDYIEIGVPKTLTAEVTPDVDGEYTWSTTPESGVRFMVGSEDDLMTASGNSVIIVGKAPDPDAHVTVTFTSEPDDRGESIEVTKSITLGVVGVSHLVWSDSPSGPWSALPFPLFVPMGATKYFKAIASPVGSPWPVGMPTWSGSSGSSGVGEIQEVTFETASSTLTDYKTVIASCGTWDAVANVIVVTLEKIEWNDNGTWSDVASPMYVTAGTVRSFRAVAIPEGAPWPGVYPEWAQDGTFAGYGGSWNFTFTEPAKDRTDYTVVSATYGDESDSVDVLVFDKLIVNPDPAIVVLNEERLLEASIVPGVEHGTYEWTAGTRAGFIVGNQLSPTATGTGVRVIGYNISQSMYDDSIHVRYTSETDAVGRQVQYEVDVPLTVIALDHIEVHNEANDTWVDPTDPFFVTLERDTRQREVHFRAVIAPWGAEWPDGKPVWSGTANPSGNGDQATVIFDSATTNPSTVTAACGSTDTVNVYVLDTEIGMDGDRDGEIDRNSPGSWNYLFWVNDDYDNMRYDPAPWELIWAEDDEEVGLLSTANCNDDVIGHKSGVGTGCARDLEDFARLHIWIPESLRENPAFTFHLAISSWRASASANLFEAVNPTESYLKDKATSDTQLAKTRILTIGSTEVLLDRQYIQPDGAVSPFLIEGASQGHGNLDLITKYNGIEVSRRPINLDLEPITYFYEKYKVTGSSDSWDAIVDSVPSSNQNATEYTPLTDEYLLFVHGYNMGGDFNKDRWAETVFKRLWWQGYKGHVGCYQWPDMNVDLSGINYSDSEYHAWNSAEGLAGLLLFLNNEHPGNVRMLAHSQGNVVASEAVRMLPPNTVNIYIASQAALPAHMYIDSDTLNAATTETMETPNVVRHYTKGISPDLGYFAPNLSRTTIINFFNEEDLPLKIWWWVNLDKPFDWGFMNWRYTEESNNIEDYDPTNGDWFWIDHLWPTPNETLIFNADRYKIFSFIAESRSFALGRVAHAVGSSSSVNLRTFGYNNEHYSHSREFRSNVIDEWDYWSSVADKAQLSHN